MYMSRVTLRTDGGRMADLVQSLRGGYRIHQALWRLFGDDPEASRDFLYRQEAQRGIPSFLMVSRRRPEDREGMWRVESKAYQPRLASSQRLAFSLRVNPVVSRRDGAGRQHRHDVVMDLKRQLREKGQRANQVELTHRAAWDWFRDRAPDLGCSLDEGAFRAEAYCQHELQKGGRAIRFSTVDCGGLLTVTDVERFTTALYTGVGPAKGFGCGLLLVRRL